MSSCDAFCSTCCHQGSCASATSDSSPTVNAPRCCRCACDCWADHSKTQLRSHHRPPISLIHSGTVHSAAEPCASSNGSLPRNSCFARRLNRTGAQHEVLLTSSVTARASARTRILCRIWSVWLGWLFLQPSTDASLCCFFEHRTVEAAHPTQLGRCLIPPHPTGPIQST